MLRLSKDAINELPLFHYPGEIILVRTLADCKAAVEKIQRCTAVGLDTETRPSFRKGRIYPPSLVQLATPDAIYLFQLEWIPFGSPLASLFENPALIKTGVAVNDDLRFLAKLHPFAAQSVVDLGLVAKANKIEDQGLRGLVGQFLQVRISKGERCSNWSNKELTPQQIRYAATDAWASLAVYLQMKKMGIALP